MVGAKSVETDVLMGNPRSFATELIRKGRDRLVDVVIVPHRQVGGLDVCVCSCHLPADSPFCLRAHPHLTTHIYTHTKTHTQLHTRSLKHTHTISFPGHLLHGGFLRALPQGAAAQGRGRRRPARKSRRRLPQHPARLG